MIIFGLDPGYAIVGYGIIEYKANKFRVIDYGAITTSKDDDLNDRLLQIYNQLMVQKRLQKDSQEIMMC